VCTAKKDYEGEKKVLCGKNDEVLYLCAFVLAYIFIVRKLYEK